MSSYCLLALHARVEAMVINTGRLLFLNIFFRSRLTIELLWIHFPDGVFYWRDPRLEDMKPSTAILIIPQDVPLPQEYLAWEKWNRRFVIVAWKQNDHFTDCSGVLISINSWYIYHVYMFIIIVLEEEVDKWHTKDKRLRKMRPLTCPREFPSLE